MRKTNSHASLGATLVRGAAVGLAGTQALDWLSSALYERESRHTRDMEDRARGHMHAYEVAVARMAARLGIELTRDEIARWGWRLHKAFGIAGGVGYVALRRKMPKIGAAWGLGFGVAFFAIGDELLVPLLGLTPGPRAFSWKVHARGAAAHVAYAVAAEAVSRAIDAWWPRRR